MTYRTTHKMFSLKYPDKTWDNIDDFWTDHAEEDSEIDVVLDNMESSGKLVITESLSSDGKYVNFQKDFDSEDTYLSYKSENNKIIGSKNETHYRFEKVFKGTV